MVNGEGPIPARIMLVGEAPGVEEERAGTPFVGASGQELNRMLRDAGILRTECFVTNVCRERPPGNDISAFIAEKKKDRTPAHIPLHDKLVLPPVKAGYDLLLREIALVQPNVIVAFGNVSMWALTKNWGITKWRGSILQAGLECGTNGDRSDGGISVPKIIPTFHPAAILRQWELRVMALNDLRRVRKHSESRDYSPPAWNFDLRPDAGTVLSRLLSLGIALHQQPVWIDLDLETRAGHIACCGLSWSLTDAISIPFMCVENSAGYWSLEEEAAIIHNLYQILTHPNARIRWQNGLYDAQYIYRHWHFIPHGAQDTMISHHVAFAGLPKRLDFQASMYCENYVYWKDDGKTWDRKMGEDQLWAYNCVDCVRTRECGEVETRTIDSLGLRAVEDFQQKLFWPVLEAMNRGVRIDEKVRDLMAMELQEEMEKREKLFFDLLGHQLNPRSSKQMTELFYHDLQQPGIMTRAKKGIPGHLTCDDEALEKMTLREPILIPLVRAIREYRSLGVFLSTFVLAGLDTDRRMRCSYNICGTETYRFSSSKNPFGTGTNMQNIPKGDDPNDPATLTLPNIRELFIPDPGFSFFDMDLDRADLQVVVWEADDTALKQALREGVDLHTENARVLGISRQLAKSWVHGTNYGGGPRTMAAACGITVHQAERMRERWMQAHPGIRSWHARVETQLKTRRYVDNRLGYRRYYFERIEGLLPEALAWIPQSTVACVINRAWMNIYENLKPVWVLLQVHDSLAGQFPTHRKAELLPRIKELSQITIPYDDPLVIPIGIKTSETSWGDCK